MSNRQSRQQGPPGSSSFRADRRAPRLKNRRGASLVEVISTGIVISSLMVLVIPVLTLVSAERQAAEKQRLALMEVSNVMERATVRSWDELTPDSLSDIRLSESVEQALPDAEFNVSVTETDNEPRAKRITVELRWRNRAGELGAPVRLSSWVYRHEEAN